jgi:predicted nucleic acid-binding Zn ribbon protein
MKSDLAREIYKSWRNQTRKNKGTAREETREKIDDPKSMKDLLADLVDGRDWRQGIAEGTLFTEWKSVVGDEIAQHATPITLIDGLLTIQTTSSAWATQMKLISTQLLKTISESAPGALVEQIEVIGPHAPSWKKGIRTIKNARGPRDTYG